MSASHAEPARAGPIRPSNRWQQLRAMADLSIVVAEGLSLHQQIKEVLHDSGFSSKLQPTSRVPRAYSTNELVDGSDVESEVDERDRRDEDYVPTHERHPAPSRADRHALGNVAVAIGLRPSSGRRAPRAGVAPAGPSGFAPSAAAAEEPADGVRPSKTKKKRKRNGRTTPASPSRRSRSRSPEVNASPPTTPAVPTALPLADEGTSNRKRQRRGMGRRHHARANLDPAQKLAAKAEDKQRRKRSRLGRLHAILMSAETTQRRMRSQTAQAAKDRRLAAPRMITLLKAAVTVRADIPIERMFHGSSYFSNTYHVLSDEMGRSTADNERAVPALHPRCNDEVLKLVEDEGYLYVANDLRCPQTCLDQNRRPFAIKPRQPQGDWYPKAIVRVGALLAELRMKLKLQDKSPNVCHTRGQFPRFTFGASHGGGQKRPTRIAPDWSKHNEKLIVAFLNDPDVVKVIQHIESCVFTWLPDVAAIYKRLEARLEIPHALRTSRLFNLPFAAHTLNLGPYVRCWFHRDARNFTLGWCPVLVLGQFDHRTSAHFIMVEPRIVMELRPGDLLLIMSSVITHGTAPLLAGETRMSWTCFTAGAFFRWDAAGGKLVGDLTEEEHAAYLERSAEIFAEAWRANLTIDQLEERYRAEVGSLHL